MDTVIHGEFCEDDLDQGVQRIYSYSKKSSYRTNKQNVDLVESERWGQMLFLDGVLQSTTHDEILYHNALVHPLLDTIKEKKKILILGGGEGATAREVLRWRDVESVVMVDYDKELVDIMKDEGKQWSQGAFSDPRLTIVYEDAWKYIENDLHYNGVIIDLTDPVLTKESWKPLLEGVIRSIKGSGRGGFVMNAGLYTPWNTEHLISLKALIQELCLDNPQFEYYMYTAIIPSFNGEWTYIVMSQKSRHMINPEHLSIIPSWIRRSIRILDPLLIDEAISSDPIVSEIVSYV